MNPQERADALDLEAHALLGTASVVIENFVAGGMLGARYKRRRGEAWLAQFEAHMKASKEFTAELLRPDER